MGIISPCFGGEQTIKTGIGYKEYISAGHNNLMHSGRYFYGGYGYTFGKVMLNRFQFQVSNSNKEVQYELPYVSANSNIDITQEFNFPVYKTERLRITAGGFVGNSFSLNFFPLIDNKNFIWENHTFVGISSQNTYAWKEYGDIKFNFLLPIFSTLLSHRFDRLEGDAPETTLSLWEVMNKNIGLPNELFKPTIELGFERKVFGNTRLGAYYQGEFNWYERSNGYRAITNAHSFSFRISY